MRTITIKKKANIMRTIILQITIRKIKKGIEEKEKERETITTRNVGYIYSKYYVYTLKLEDNCYFQML